MGREVAGKLSERVCIQKRSGRTDATGALQADWATVTERWAGVQPAGTGVSAFSSVGADTWLTSRRWRVTLRAGVYLSLDQRLVWRGRPMRIVGIHVDPAQPDLVMVLAEEWGN
ncbi:MAG: head-tail adaptor protein [Sphingomonadaceae bacterium]